jgi:hypothetical protein
MSGRLRFVFERDVAIAGLEPEDQYAEPTTITRLVVAGKLNWDWRAPRYG